MSCMPARWAATRAEAADSAEGSSATGVGESALVGGKCRLGRGLRYSAGLEAQEKQRQDEDRGETGDGRASSWSTAIARTRGIRTRFVLRRISAVFFKPECAVVKNENIDAIVATWTLEQSANLVVDRGRLHDKHEFTRYHDAAPIGNFWPRLPVVSPRFERSERPLPMKKDVLQGRFETSRMSGRLLSCPGLVYRIIKLQSPLVCPFQALPCDLKSVRRILSGC